MIDEQAYQIDQRTLAQRVLAKLFPYRFPEKRSDFMERGSGKGLTTLNYIYLDWTDRIRVLCGGIIKIEVTSNTEYEPGKTESISFVNIRPPGSMPNRSGTD